MTQHSDNLREHYASNPRGTFAIDTLELRHPGFLGEDGVTPAAVRLANDPDPLIATLEDDAPMNAGEEVTFDKGEFEITLPESSASIPTMQIAAQNVGRSLMKPIAAAAAIPEPVVGTYRQYLADDPSAPGVVIDGFTIRKVNATPLRVTAQAGFEDDLNVPFGREKYTPEEYPGLVR
jgi:hypothetical protein